MNPFKKRKEAREAQAREFDKGLLQIEQQFDAAIKEADQLTDPAGRILALRKIRNDIYAQMGTETKAITQEATTKGKRADQAGTGVTIAATVTTGALLTGPVGWVCLPVAAVGIIGSAVVSEKRREAVMKRLVESSSSHIKRLFVQAEHAEELVDAVIENNVEALSKSPLKGKVLALPGLAAKFSEAAAKHIAAPKYPEAAETTPAEAAPKKLRLIKDGKHL